MSEALFGVGAAVAIIGASWREVQFEDKRARAVYWLGVALLVCSWLLKRGGA